MFRCDLKNKSKEEEYYIILRKLISKYGLQRKDFEKTAEREEFGYSFGSNLKEEILPHSSVIKRLTELRIMGAIDERKSDLISKKGLPMMKYSITILGLLFLFRLCYGKKISFSIVDEIGNQSYLLGLIIELLLKYFSKKQIFETLTAVCYNTTIQVGHGKYGRAYLEKPYDYYIDSDHISANKEFKITGCFLQTRFQRDNFPIVVSRAFSVYGDTTGNTQKYINIEPQVGFWLICLLLHELLLRSTDPSKYNSRRGEYGVLGIVINSSKIRDDYLDFLKEIEWEMDYQRGFIEEIKYLITGKRSKIGKILRG